MTEKTPADTKPQPAKTRSISKKAAAPSTMPNNPEQAAPAKTAPTARRVKLETIKPAKARMVRDSYAMPEADHALLAELKKSCQQSGEKVKKGELLRVALHLLAKQKPADIFKSILELRSS